MLYRGKIIQYLLVLTMPLGSSAQLQHRKDTAYEYKMNKAEILITKFDNASAFKIYQSFQLSDLKFKDLFNFYLLSAERSDVPNALKAAQEMAERGVSGRFFTFSKFAILRKHPSFDSIKEKANRQYLTRRERNKEYVRALDSLFALDQQVFTYRREKKLFGHFPDSLANINDNNMREQLRLIGLYGLPDEKVLGPAFTGDTTFSRYHKYILVPIHCLQMSKDSLLRRRCREVYVSALFRGEMDRALFNQLQAISGLDMTGSLGERVYCKYNHCLYKGNSFTEKSIKFIDAFREKYGYCSLADLEAKLKFYLRYYSKRYRFDLTYTYLPPGMVTEKEFKERSEDYRLLYDPRQ